jgi:DNA-binding GntR family transcriptional regulator
MSLAATAPQTLRGKAYESFTECLLAREISPGQFVSQRELVEITGMPLGAIREMIPRLEADGLIRAIAHRGLQVAPVDLILIRNAFQLRLMIEREAVSGFCASASDAELAALRAAHLEIIAQQAAAGSTADLLERAQHLDWSFHARMVEALDNALLADIYRVNSVKIRLIRQAQTRILPALVGQVMAEHLAILDALTARDCAGALAAMAAHIEVARRRALDI